MWAVGENMFSTQDRHTLGLIEKSATSVIRSFVEISSTITIKTKLYCGATLSLVVICMLAVVNMSVSRQNNAALNQVYEQVLIPTEALQQTREGLLDIELGAERALDEQATMSDARLQLFNSRKELTAGWMRFRKSQEQTEVSEEELGLSRTVDKQIAEIQPLFDQLEKAYAEKDTSLVLPQLALELRVLHVNLIPPLNKLRAIEQAEAKDAADHSARLSKRMTMLSAVAIAFSILSVAGFAVWLIGYIERNIDKINRAITEVAAGKLDVNIAVTARDEIGNMASSLNRTLAIIKAGRESLEALRHRDELILNALGEGLFGEDATGRITFVNPAMEKMLGWAPHELVGKPSRDLFDGDTAGERERLLHSLADEISHTAGDRTILRKVGSLVPVDYTYAAIREEGQIVGAVSVFRDISDRKAAQNELMCRYAKLLELNQRLEEAQGQLLQSEKMASLGQLAAGVAHEINNPVGFVKSNIKSFSVQVKGLLALISAYERAEPLLSAQSEARAAIAAAKKTADLAYVREDIEQLLEESMDGVERIARIVRDLKEFSYPENSGVRMADLHRGLDSTLNIVWNELKYKATIVKEYGQVPQIECDPAQLNQVFMNLMVNAAHAIEKKGLITIRTRIADAGVVVEIADTGKGIAPEHLTRIFEPFFTTKPVGEGTGLGLSLAYGIIKKHGGTITVQSEVNQGTVFSIWLPLAQNATSS